MADGKKITELPVEESLTNDDIILVGSNNTSSLKRSTLGDLLKYVFGGKSLVDRIYPVGSIYMSVASTNPGTLFGGTWTPIEGQFLIGQDKTYTAGSTGGKVTTTLTTANLPAHTHTGPSHTHTGPSHSHTITVAESGVLKAASAGSHTHKGYTILEMGSGKNTRLSSSAAPNAQETSAAITGSSGSHTHDVPSHKHTATCSSAGTGNTGASGTGATGSTGSGSPFSNMPPYLAVYMWKRTA